MLPLSYMPYVLLRYNRKLNTTSGQGLCPFFEAIKSPVPCLVAGI